MSTRTLVLDQGYQPHRIISWQRAVSLFFQEKCEIIETYDEDLMTPEQASRAEECGWTVVLKVPAVVRLLSRVRRKKAVRFSRLNILTRDDWTCQYCGVRHFGQPKKLNYDHVIPRSRGGRTVWENIVTSCIPCNSKKDNRTPQEAGMHLRKQPYKPRSLPVAAFHIDTSGGLPSAWRDYIFWRGELEQD
jgi:5-methylcytosine-specific restriction endonuclease McrA